MVGVKLEPRLELAEPGTVKGRVKVALGEHVAHQSAVGKFSDFMVGRGPLAGFLEREDFHIARGGLCRQHLWQRCFFPGGLDFGIKRGGVDGLDGGSSGAGQRQRGECDHADEGKGPRGGSDPKTVSVVPWHGTLNNG